MGPFKSHSLLLPHGFMCFLFFVFLCRGIFFVTKGTFGQLTCEWQYLFEEFTKDPMIVENRRLRIEAKVQIARQIKQKLDVFLTGDEYF